MAVTSSKGTIIYISPKLPAAYTEAGYRALIKSDSSVEDPASDEKTNTFVKLAMALNLPAFGLDWEVIRETPMETGIIIKGKGVSDPGSLDVEMLLDEADSGQPVMEAALAAEGPVSFAVRYKAGTSGKNGLVYYFRALVTRFRPSAAGASSFAMRSAGLELDLHAPIKSTWTVPA